MNGALNVQGLRVRQGDFVLDVPEVRVNSGEILAIVGPSGGGKTTLLLAIAGFLPLETGEIRIGETSIASLPPERRRIALMFQRSALFPHLTVLENVEFSARVNGVEKTQRAREAREWLGRVGVGELADRRTHEISEGQAQRVALARALATKFPVLLLDEPFSALDEGNRLALRSLVKDLVLESGTAAIFVTHHLADAKATSERIVTVENGRLRA